MESNDRSVAAQPAAGSRQVMFLTEEDMETGRKKHTSEAIYASIWPSTGEVK